MLAKHFPQNRESVLLPAWRHLLFKSKPASLGFEFVGDALCKVHLRLNLVTSRIIHFYLVSLVELCRLIKEVSLAKIVIVYPFN